MLLKSITVGAEHCNIKAQEKMELFQPIVVI